MNRIAPIIRKQDKENARKLLNKLQHSAEKLTIAEVDAIYQYVSKPSISYDLGSLFWLLSIHTLPNQKLIALAMNELNYESIPAANVDDERTDYLAQMLAYILRQTGDDFLQSLVERFSDGPLRLRQVIAEYLIEIGSIERGLRLMVSFAAKTSTDHALADAIAMWLTAVGTTDLKHSFITEAKQADLHGDSNTAAVLRWASACINS